MATTNHDTPRDQDAAPKRWYQSRRVQASISGSVVIGLFTLGAALLSRRPLPGTTYTKPLSARLTEDWGEHLADGELSVFSAGSVFPRGFEPLGPGTQVSVLQSIYPPPEGKLSLTHFEVLVRVGPFERIWYYHDGQKDPTVTSVVFWFRERFAQTHVWKDALKNFADFPYTSRVLGRVLEYRNVNGYRIVLDDASYQIHPASVPSG